jgi:OFA family oxalate/formate antiporter-like MFS transporter
MVRRLLPGVYEGWIVVGAGGFIILTVGAIFFWGFGAIFNEMIDEFGWSVAATAFAFSLRTEVSGVSAPVIGVIIDRFGTQRVMVAGVLLTVVGFIAISLVQTIEQFYAGMILTAIGTSACGYPVAFAATATWFNRRRSSAMALITVGGAIGGIFAVVVGQLVEVLGWRAALQWMAVGMLAIGVVTGLNVRSRPDGHPQPIDGDAAPPQPAQGASDAPPPAATAAAWGVPVLPAILSRSFIMMSLGVIALSFATNAVVVHQIPYLEKELGASKALAASSVAVFSIVSISGRLGIGVLADRYSKRVMLGVTALLTAIGLPILAVADSFTMAMIGILVIAPAFGGLLPVRPAILADYFGTKHFGTINGIAMLVTTTGGAVGPWVVGRVVDVTGNYAVGWWLCAAMAVIAIPLLLVSTPPAALIARHRAGGEAGAAPIILDTH